MTSDKRPWYEELFESGDYVRFWLGGEEAPRIAPERTRREVDFIIDTLRLPAGAHILDLCCGHGRHSIALAGRGYRVTGLDLSARHLDMARKGAAAAGVDVAWVREDMRNIPKALGGDFDAVINIFTAFGYFESDSEDQKVLDAVNRTVRPGGLFLIDTLHRDGLFRRFRPRDWEEIDDAVILRERTFDFLSSRSTETMHVIKAGEARRTTSFTVRQYTLTELAGMMGRAGLDVKGYWGGFDGSELSMDSLRLIVLAEKR